MTEASNAHRELPHCPQCSDDLILAFDEARIEKDNKVVILDVPKMKCPSCDFVGVKPSLSQATEVGAAQFFGQGMDDGLTAEEVAIVEGSGRRKNNGQNGDHG